MTVMANDIKTKGVSLFDTLFEKFSEVIISVRGKNKYCVIPYEEYEEYRAYKLDMAHKEVMEDIANEKYHTNTQKHFDTLKEALKDA
ncbi:MAG: Addiction module antitoxin [uncultured Sulfurovum sp.]|nr:MAG: Addiction module antitoxin [uncultured Sulfurovum sp.]